MIASHIKPWAASTPKEKIDPYNGYILSPLFDKLFDRGFITFTENRHVILSDFISPFTWKQIALKMIHLSKLFLWTKIVLNILNFIILQSLKGHLIIRNGAFNKIFDCGLIFVDIGRIIISLQLSKCRKQVTYIGNGYI